MHTYDEVKPIDRNIAEVYFSSGDPECICNALVAITFHDQDWKWVQEKCLFFLMSENTDISGLSATCLGHIARIHGQLDEDRVVNMLQERLTDPQLSGRIEDALDDIEMFLPK